MNTITAETRIGSQSMPRVTMRAISSSPIFGDAQSLRPFSDADHEINHDGSIDDDRGDLRGGDTLANLVDFEREEGSGDDDREPLAPSFPHQEPGPLQEEESGVGECEASERLDFPVV